MATTLDKIIGWACLPEFAGGMPDWQSDAVRRLLTKGKLGDIEKKEIVGMIKARHELEDTQNPTPTPQRIKLGDVSGVQAANRKLFLKEISGIKHVNALKDAASIPFGHTGLTIVYGQNGTGKSGYARVLKRACKARDMKDLIHPNINSTTPPGPASAIFDLQIDGVDQQISWQEGDDASEVLSSICVFDGRCARIIVDDKNDAHYLPFGAQVFAELVILLKEIRLVLQAEKPDPQKPDWPDIPADTIAGNFFQTLTVDTDLQKLGQWTEDDETELSDVTKRLAQAETDDPIKIGQRLRNLATRLRKFAQTLTDFEKEISTSVELAIIKTLKSLAAAKQALKEAPKIALMDEPLPGIGSETWQILYRAARDFSVQVAYPDNEFPHTGQDCRCVLCMQPLLVEAKDRLNLFRDYMEQAAKKKVDELTQELKDARQKLPSVEPNEIDQFKDVIDELVSRKTLLADAVSIFVASVNGRSKALQGLVHSENMTPILSMAENPASIILTASKSIEAEAQDVEKTADATVLTGLRANKREGDARKVLISRRTTLDKYIQDLKQASQFDQCIAEINTKEVTTTGKKIISESLTPELQKALECELVALGASHLPLNLKPVGGDGETSHQLELEATKPIKKAKLTDILSEGEHRVVAIAGFLAELEVAGHSSTIVFDDPVSSLDHRFRSKIAERLTAEAAKRQVIIFTHDLSLLMEVQSNVDNFGINEFGKSFGGIPITVQTVSRKGDVTGHIEDGPPWSTKKVGERLNLLRQDLVKIKPRYSQDQDSYNKSAAMLYGRLRETWEAFIEGTLFFGVVSRHQTEVKTLKLSGVNVRTEDAVAVFLGMKKTSTWMIGHEKAKPLDVNRPDPSEIEKDIEALQDLEKSFNQRRKQSIKDFEARFIPPKTAKGATPCLEPPTASL